MRRLCTLASVAFAFSGSGIAAELTAEISKDDAAFITKAITAMVGSGILLELLNYFFLAKRQRVKRLSAELDEARQDSEDLAQKIRESSRV